MSVYEEKIPEYLLKCKRAKSAEKKLRYITRVESLILGLLYEYVALEEDWTPCKCVKVTERIRVEAGKLFGLYLVPDASDRTGWRIDPNSPGEIVMKWSPDEMLFNVPARELMVNDWWNRWVTKSEDLRLWALFEKKN